MPTHNLRAVALEMIELDRRIRKLALLGAELRALPDDLGLLAVHHLDREQRLLKFTWHEKAGALGIAVTATARDIRRLVAKLEAEHRAAYEHA